jgi:hypothetical protein
MKIPKIIYAINGNNFKQEVVIEIVGWFDFL